MQLIIADKRYSSWSLRGWLAVQLAGEPCEEILVRLYQPDTRARLLTHSGAGKVPILKTAHGVIADSLAIAEYLAERHPGLWPEDVAARALARSACAQMHSGFTALRQAMPFDLHHDAPLQTVSAELQGDLDRMLELLGECRAARTSEGPWLFGEQSLADAYFAPIAVRLRSYQVALPAEVADWADTIYQWPAFKAWQAAGLEET
ncbi:glutathione S-transferase family protein [Pseudomonas sp. KNUC1026]|uniref:glutathione S-transferase family protein n=1 Tax=Pseudomonas sp. KNUC1026 TaxID=2893890 RepID=UPI001F24DB8C|nr:glutathione S-transferase family protein [Pseudomonas sp. KNUC1026]UFH48524.1 glutathione S-transferase family protein [Pseudomonas sp. KNUC1026]